MRDENELIKLKCDLFPDNFERLKKVINWFFGGQLNKLGVSIVNTKADKTCFADRKLITDASPKAANEFGKLAAIKLLEYLNE